MEKVFNVFSVGVAIPFMLAVIIVLFPVWLFWVLLASILNGVDLIVHYFCGNGGTEWTGKSTNS
jgi:hypothetical protein